MINDSVAVLRRTCMCSLRTMYVFMLTYSTTVTVVSLPLGMNTSLHACRMHVRSASQVLGTSRSTSTLSRCTLLHVLESRSTVHDIRHVDLAIYMYEYESWSMVGHACIRYGSHSRSFRQPLRHPDLQFSRAHRLNPFDSFDWFFL